MVAQIDSTIAKYGRSAILTRLLSYSLFEGRPVTTRGRWINPFLRAFLKSASQRISLPQVTQPLFILGTGRSGSTILGKILGLHKDVGWLNEPKLLWNIAYANEDLVGSYTSEPARYRLDAADASPDVKEKLHRLYTLYLRVVGKARLLDKYPELIFRTAFVQAIFPDAKFIVLIRNGYDVCQSIDNWNIKHTVTTQSNIADWWGVNNRKWNYLVNQLANSPSGLTTKHNVIANFSSEVDKAAVEWILTMKEALRLLESNPSNMYFLKYENLLGATEETLSKLLIFCELEKDDNVINYAKDVLIDKREHTPPDLDPAIRREFNGTMTQLGYKL